MKYKFTRTHCLNLIMCMCLILLSGCGGPSKEAVMKQLSPTGEEKYAIHLFYKHYLPDSEGNEVLIFHNSDPAIQESINKVQFWDVDLERDMKWAKVLGIKEFPMYLVLDQEGVVLETQYLSKVKQFLTETLLPE